MSQIATQHQISMLKYNCFTGSAVKDVIIPINSDVHVLRHTLQTSCDIPSEELILKVYILFIKYSFF